MNADGKDVEEYGVPGEVLFSSPNLFVGYIGNEPESLASFDADGWLRTGDVGMMQVGAGGNEHLFIRDRIKDMIKVKVIYPFSPFKSPWPLFWHFCSPAANHYCR